MKPKGFYVDPKAWSTVPKQRIGFYAENPPDDWEDIASSADASIRRGIRATAGLTSTAGHLKNASQL